jgi:hypothetical protein
MDRFYDFKIEIFYFSCYINNAICYILFLCWITLCNLIDYVYYKHKIDDNGLVFDMNWLVFDMNWCWNID